MSELIIVDNTMTSKPRETLRTNGTVVVFENDGQAVAAMLENYRRHIRVWFDDAMVQWPYQGMFNQRIIGLPVDHDKRRRFVHEVHAHFQSSFAVQYVELEEDSDNVVVVADGTSTRAPRNWEQYVINPPTR